VGASNSLKSPVTFTAELVDFGVKPLNDVDRLLDRRPESPAVALPALNAVHFGSSSPHFSVDPLTQLALLPDRHGHHNEFHTACFTGTVFSVTMLTEVAPFPVTADKTMLIEEAHVSNGYIAIGLDLN
jgi:hypothetical protein